MASSHQEVTVIMVPLPEHGHLTQLFRLSDLLCAHHIPVHYLCDIIHASQLKRGVHYWNPSIQFHEFATTSSPSPIQRYINAATELRPHVAELLRAQASTARRVVVIHDSLMTSAVQDVVSVTSAESYAFHSISALGMVALNTKNEKSFPSFVDGFYSRAYKDFWLSHYAHKDFNSGNIYNTSRLIEGAHIERLSKTLIWGSYTQWPIGPFNPMVTSSKRPRDTGLKWLKKQEPKSVIFVSLGTTTSLSREQITELALGLEKSTQKFLWVLREKDKHGVSAAEEEGNRSNEVSPEDKNGVFATEEEEKRSNSVLPEGYEERVKDKGMVVRDWAPQLKILGHKSTGGFMSDCGWESCIESISMGVPVAAWPLDTHQPFNAFLLTKWLKIGVEVKDLGEKDDELVTSETVEKAVRKLMGSEGELIRKRAINLGAAVRRSVEMCGDSPVQLQSFISHITR